MEGSKKGPASGNKAASCRSLVYFRDFVCSKECPSKAKLENKTVIITGGNAGIGKETALELCNRGGKVIIACRDIKRGEEAAADIRNKSRSASVTVKQLDLASFVSIRKFAQHILETEPQIHILINNAGVAGCSKSSTEEGFEMHFGINHLGHFLLTNLLLERMKASAPARIITVASVVHIFGKIDFEDLNYDHNYKPLKAYCRSKLANLLFTKELAKRLKGTKVTTYCLHPGVSHTGIGRHLDNSINKFTGHVYEGCSKILWKSACKGAQTTVYCAVDESLANDSGNYYVDCSSVKPSVKAQDHELAKTLWDISEKLTSTL